MSNNINSLENVKIINHPLLQHKLGHLRNKQTSPQIFRALVFEISLLLIYEATKDLPLLDSPVETWCGPLNTKKITVNQISIVPIMRAGIGMLDAALHMLPNAKVHFLGIFREESTTNPVVYYDKITTFSQNHSAFIIDPMLATGGTTCRTISLLRDKGCQKIVVVAIIASEEGALRVLRQHNDVAIYCAALDAKLNPEKYIVPGLGDAGDRIYNT